jgi:hypothetical protein
MIKLDVSFKRHVPVEWLTPESVQGILKQESKGDRLAETPLIVA